MPFARKVWTLLVAIKDGLALLVLLLFFMGIYAALSARPNPGSVREGALLLKLDGAIVEEPSAASPFEMLFASEAPLREYGVHELIRALRAAARDSRIKAVVLDLSRFSGGGQVQLHDVGAALDEVRAAKKPVLAYAQLYTDDGIQLAAHASEVWVDPLGGAVPTGPGGTHLYYGPLLDRLKITAHVFRVGSFKSAVEPFTRDGMSPEARENYSALYSALWEGWRTEVARARPKANIAMVTSDPTGWLKASGGDAARAALAAGLVDRIGDHAAFGTRVAQLVGRDTINKRPGSYAHSSLDAWLAANRPPSTGKSIGIVTIAGEIVPGRAGPGRAGSERIVRLLDSALDQKLAALVVRVDSPGGSVTASEDIRAAIARFKARGIPVVVSMGNLAASGGYWVSTPADRIFAEPSAITGSIGVFAVLPSFERLLANYGVTSDGLRTTPLSGQPDPAAGYSPEFSAMVQSSVEFTYRRFVALVAGARHRTPQQIDAIAQGRVWDGGTARQIGLIDQFGGLDDALAYAANGARLRPGEWHAVFLGREKPGFAKFVEAMTASGDDASDEGARDWAGLAAERRSALVRRALADVERLGGESGVQAYCLDCPITGGGTPPGKPQPETLDLLSRLLAFRKE
ncbi:MAG: signal peptide peptidase SppA [Novosphingobium sp.]